MDASTPLLSTNLHSLKEDSSTVLGPATWEYPSHPRRGASFFSNAVPTEGNTMTTTNTDLKSIIGTLTAALGELSTRLDGGGAPPEELLARITKLEEEVRKLETGNIDVSEVAANIDMNDLANNLDVSEVAGEISLSDVAGEISLSDLASEFSLRELAEEIDIDSKVESAIEDTLDVDEIASQVKDSLNIEEEVKAVLKGMEDESYIRKLVREEIAAALKSVRLTVEAE